MKKLVLVVVLLIAVLLLSWWARGANFNLSTMMQSVQRPSTATNSAMKAFPTVAPTSTPIEIIITITPNGFVPDVIMIDTNTKITWVNKSGSLAGIVSDPQDPYTPLNVGDIPQNGSASVIFSKSGRYHYLNSKNPQEKGTLVVK